jgi:hypothetical protein
MEGEGCFAEDATEGTSPVEEAGSQHNPTVEEGEFHITIRKLELPVRPRGVLAE